jgi:hypothetical protein
MRTKFYSIFVFLILLCFTFFLMHCVQTSNDLKIEQLEKEVEIEILEKHIDKK